MEEIQETLNKKIWKCPELLSLNVRKTEGGDYTDNHEDLDHFNLDSNPN